MAFKAPSNYEQILRETVSRVNRLIDLKYLDNIDKGTIKTWLQNFHTKEEKYFAALILHKLIYRSEKAIISMFENLIEIILPNIFLNLKIDSIDSISEWKQLIKDPQKTKTLNFCISTITGVDQNIGKSGEDLNRLFKEKQIIHKNINFNFSSDKTLPKRLKYLILIDDIAGTGTQFEKFYKKNKSKLTQFEHIIYVPLAAFYKSITYITNLDTRIHMEPLEVLNEDKVFISDSTEKIDGTNSLKDLKSFYNLFLKEKKLNLYDEYSVNTLYIFKISSPNTNLPLIYHESDNWNKLFFRF